MRANSAAKTSKRFTGTVYVSEAVLRGVSGSVAGGAGGVERGGLSSLEQKPAPGSRNPQTIPEKGMAMGMDPSGKLRPVRDCTKSWRAASPEFSGKRR